MGLEAFLVLSAFFSAVCSFIETDIDSNIFNRNELTLSIAMSRRCWPLASEAVMLGQRGRVAF